MSEICTVFCSDSRCKHNKGCGVYGICHHPNNYEKPAYCGIDRTYVSTCRLCEPAMPQKLKNDIRLELLSGTWGGAKEESSDD